LARTAAGMKKRMLDDAGLGAHNSAVRPSRALSGAMNLWSGMKRGGGGVAVKKSSGFSAPVKHAKNSYYILPDPGTPRGEESCRKENTCKRGVGTGHRVHACKSPHSSKAPVEGV